VLLGNILNLPLIDRYTPPARQPDTQDPASPPNGTTQPEPADGGTAGSGNSPGQAQPTPSTPGSGNSQSSAPSNGSATVESRYRVSSMNRLPEEPEDSVRIEAWARRAALEVQKNEQFASMLQRISSPESAARIALLHKDPENGPDLLSVAAAYGENQDNPSVAPDSSEN
jgi:hypothetical protein